MAGVILAAAQISVAVKILSFSAQKLAAAAVAELEIDASTSCETNNLLTKGISSHYSKTVRRTCLASQLNDYYNLLIFTYKT